MPNENNFFRNKKTIVSFVLSLLVFFIHFRVFSVFRNAEGFVGCLFDQLMVFTKIAVPLFFAISGALFYRDYNWGVTIKKWKTRVFSLCIPYLMWNTIWLCVSFLGYYTPLGSILGGIRTSFSWAKLLNGVFLYGQFEPFWFMYQLIVLTACCPIIYLLLKNKWIGLCAIIAYYVAVSLGFQLNTTIIPDSKMVIFYLIGAWLGLHYFSLFTTRRSKKQAIGGACIYLLCCVFHWAAGALPAWCASRPIQILITVISCSAFWIAFDYLDMEKCPRYTTYSFLIYALHVFVGSAISRVISLILPAGPGYLLLTAAIAFPTTVVFICGAGFLLDRYFPRMKRILTGR